jgi:hypothetical protein
MKKTITFSGIFLSINDRYINFDDFMGKIIETTDIISRNDPENKRVHTYRFIYQGKDYLKIILGDGSASPRNPEVIDVERNERSSNPRQPNQAEPKQTFGLIDFKTGYLWLSNTKKRKSLLELFNETLGKNKLLAKDVYDEEEFINTLKKIDEISVSAAPEVFSNSNTLTKALSEDIHGFNADVAKLTFQYDKHLLEGCTLKEKIKSIFRDRNSFRSIVISGRDKNGLGMLFNTNLFSTKIEFQSLVDENEMFVPEKVFAELIQKIQ